MRWQTTATILDKRGIILSVGTNSYSKTHPIQAHYAKLAGMDYKIYLHAEIDAIIKCPCIDKAHRIVVVRYTRSGFGMAKPCPICQLAISNTPIKRIEWTSKS